MQDYYKDLRRCQNEAWGMADRLRIQQAGPKDMHRCLNRRDQSSTETN